LHCSLYIQTQNIYFTYVFYGRVRKTYLYTETDVKKLLFQQRRGVTSAAELSTSGLFARDSRAHVICTCEISLIRFNYGGVVPIVCRFESHRHECERAR